MHDSTAEHWHEIAGNTKKAGLGTFKRAPMACDRFMEMQEIPIFRGVGISKVQNLSLAPWKRMGGRGSFIQNKVSMKRINLDRRHSHTTPTGLKQGRRSRREKNLE
jgi:hypothetical protein